MNTKIPHQHSKLRWIEIFLLISMASVFIYALFPCCLKLQILSPEDVLNSSIEEICSDMKYPSGLGKYRKRKIQHLNEEIYLDYTGAGVYSDDIIKLLNIHQKNQFFSFKEIIPQVKSDLLHFFSTTQSQYSVIFTASATGALKLLGETFPFTNGSKFIYSRSNHNSVLGIRRYAIDQNASFTPIDSHENLSLSANSFIDSNHFTLFAFPLEDNFAGTKVTPSEMYKMSHLSPELTNWTKPTARVAVIADAAAFTPTNPLNLTQYPFHAICLSFYKIFGFPNIGALIIRNDLSNYLSKHRISFSSYSLPNINSNESMESFLNNQISLEDDIPDPTLAISLLFSIKLFEKIGMEKIQKNVWEMTRRLYEGLSKLEHMSGIPVVEFYGNHEFNDSDKQGGIVAFNIKDEEGKYLGYYNVVKEASKEKFNLRGGCQCNPGSCFKSVKLTEDQVLSYYGKKTTCGDTNDIVNGIPLGAVRASVGWATTPDDVDQFVKYISETYV